MQVPCNMDQPKPDRHLRNDELTRDASYREVERVNDHLTVERSVARLLNPHPDGPLDF